MATKLCPKCKDSTLLETDFWLDKTRRDGLTTYCKKCSKERAQAYQARNKERINAERREWRERNIATVSVWERKSYYNKTQKRRLVRQQVLSKNPCISCGEKRYPCLHFHHLDPTLKAAAVAECRTTPAFLREIQKCTVLCANCHLLYHAGELALPTEIKYIDTSQFS